MKNGHALRSIDSSFKQRQTQYYLALNTSLLSVSVHQSRCCPRNRRHKNNRAIPPTLTEADLFGPFDQVIHLLALSVFTDCDNALVVSAQAEKERQCFRQNGHGYNIVFYCLFKIRIQFQMHSTSQYNDETRFSSKVLVSTSHIFQN